MASHPYAHAYADPQFWEDAYADENSEMSTMDWYGLGASVLWPIICRLLPSRPMA